MRPLLPSMAVLSFLAVVSSANQASAYVPLLTPEGCNPVHWARSCVFITADPVGTPELPFSSIERIVRQSLDAWNTPNRGNSFMALNYVASSTPQEVGNDGWQVVKIRNDRWCRPADANNPEICYDSSAIAITTISYVTDPSDPENDGRIVDADIELNGVQNLFYDAATGQAPPNTTRRRMDLWNTLAHELGHLQGLDHTCRSNGWAMPACARDNEGQEVAFCEEVEEHRENDAHFESIFESTMYPCAEPDETSKRTPKADDLAAIRDLYPIGDVPDVCSMPGEETQTDDSSTHLTKLPPVTARCSISSLPSNSDHSGWLVPIAAVALTLTLRRTRSGRVS